MRTKGKVSEIEKQKVSSFFGAAARRWTVPRVLIPVSSSISSSAISESINKTWWDGGKTGMEERDGRSEAMEAASPNQTSLLWMSLLEHQSTAPDQSWTDNMLFDSTESTVIWRWRSHPGVTTHDINKCTDDGCWLTAKFIPTVKFHADVLLINSSRSNRSRDSVPVGGF